MLDWYYKVKYVTQITLCYLLNIIFLIQFICLLETVYFSVICNTPLNLPVKPVGENSRTIA